MLTDLLNLRGSDIDFNPVFFSYMLVEEETATLFIDEIKVNSEVKKYLEDAGVTIEPYDAIIDRLTKVASIAFTRAILTWVMTKPKIFTVAMDRSIELLSEWQFLDIYWKGKSSCS